MSKSGYLHDVWEALSKQKVVDLQDPLKLLLYAFMAVTTVLLIYLGWIFTKYQQMRRARLERERRHREARDAGDGESSKENEGNEEQRSKEWPAAGKYIYIL